jgi:hypothetical protein
MAREQAIAVSLWRCESKKKTKCAVEYLLLFDESVEKQNAGTGRLPAMGPAHHLLSAGLAQNLIY